MRNWIIPAAIVATLAAGAAQAQSAFCSGFAAGWRAAFQNRGQIVGIVPICPIPPIGRDTFQGGYEMGLLAALRSM